MLNSQSLLSLICPHLDYSERSLDEIDGLLEAEIMRLSFAEEERTIEEQLREYEKELVKKAENAVNDWQSAINDKLKEINRKNVPDDVKFAEFQGLLPSLVLQLKETDYAEAMSQALIIGELVGRLEVLDGQPS